VRGRPGGVLGSLLVCREDLKKFMGISKITNVVQMPGSTLSVLFFFTFLFYAHWGETCKEGAVVYRERRWTVEEGSYRRVASEWRVWSVI
jgi:hypothetical protein